MIASGNMEVVADRIADKHKFSAYFNTMQIRALLMVTIANIVDRGKGPQIEV